MDLRHSRLFSCCQPLGPVDYRIQLTQRLIQEYKGTTAFDAAGVSRLLGLSEAYLLRLFHQETRVPICEYLRNTRMDHAVELLRNHGLPIKRISVECGYSDVSNFYRDFRTVYKATPHQVRLTGLDFQTCHNLSTELSTATQVLTINSRF